MVAPQDWWSGKPEVTFKQRPAYSEAAACEGGTVVPTGAAGTKALGRKGAGVPEDQNTRGRGGFMPRM